MNYFITGLPRSKTAWLANFMSSGSSFCFHEATNGCASGDDLKRRMSTGHAFTGNSDHMLMFFPIHELFPNAPVLIVERDIHDVVESLIAKGLYSGAARDWLVESQRRMKKLKGERVKYEDVFSHLRDIWEYLVVSPYDEYRGEHMKRFNIQTVEYEADIQSLLRFAGEV